MSTSGGYIPAGSYLVSKYKQAEDKKARLLDAINRLTQLSFEKGTRHGDQVIRERVKALVAETGQYYGMIRAFSSGKAGDAFAFEDILAFFNRQYLERFILRERLEELRREFGNLDRDDRAYEEKHPGEGKRRINSYRQDLERELKEWEKLLLYQVEPLLRGFLNEVNDIFLYSQIDERLGRLVTSDDVFTRSGPVYLEFKRSLAAYAGMNIKLSRLPLTDNEIVEIINRVLQQTGFRSAILNSRNINPGIYGDIMMEVVTEGGLRHLVKQYSDVSRSGLNAIQSASKKTGDAGVGKDLGKSLEDLIYLEDVTNPQRPGGLPAASGLSKNEAGRYLFHTSGTFDISLKFVSEYMRDSTIFLLDWLNKELQKSPGSSSLLGPIVECVPSIRSFISYYKLALDTASDKSNQAGSGSKEKQFISKQIAQGLIRSIKDNCSQIQHSLIDSSYMIMNSTLERAAVLRKQIGVIQESCNASHVKINKGLSEIESV